MSVNRGATHFTLGLGHLISHPSYYKCAPLSKLPSCAPGFLSVLIHCIANHIHNRFCFYICGMSKICVCFSKKNPEHPLKFFYLMCVHLQLSYASKTEKKYDGEKHLITYILCTWRNIICIMLHVWRTGAKEWGRVWGTDGMRIVLNCKDMLTHLKKKLFYHYWAENYEIHKKEKVHRARKNLVLLANKS